MDADDEQWTGADLARAFNEAFGNAAGEARTTNAGTEKPSTDPEDCDLPPVQDDTH